MQMFTRLAALAAGLMLMLAPATAQEKIKFTLDWKLQGIHAWYYWAAEKGYFKAEGLDVSIDQGEGSAATVTRIMGAPYVARFGDMNTIIQNGSARATTTRVMVYMMNSKSPLALL